VQGKGMLHNVGEGVKLGYGPIWAKQGQRNVSTRVVKELSQKLLFATCLIYHQWTCSWLKIHIFHFCVFWAFKWALLCENVSQHNAHRDENSYGTIRYTTPSFLPSTPLRNYGCTVLNIRSRHSHWNVRDMDFWTRISSRVMQYTLARRIPTHHTFPPFLKYLPSVEIRKLDCL
jgi:hypothetical protein